MFNIKDLDTSKHLLHELATRVKNILTEANQSGVVTSNLLHDELFEIENEIINEINKR